MGKSLRKAIDEFCRECLYDPVYAKQGGGTWRKQIEDCTAPKCPLYDVRPMTAAGRARRAAGSARSKAAKARAGAKGRTQASVSDTGSGAAQ